MERTEEYNFRKDVYTTLIKFTNYRVAGLLSRERKAYKNDSVFFSELLISSGDQLSKAYRIGKMIGSYTDHFLNSFQEVVNNKFAYYVFLYQDELSLLSDSLIQSMATVDLRFLNVFNKYWKNKCSKSVRVLYYLTLLTNPKAPKFYGIGPESSRLMFEKILSFKASLDDYLIMYIGNKSYDPAVCEPNAEEEFVTETEIIKDPIPEPISEPTVPAESVPSAADISNELLPASEKQASDITQSDSIPFLKQGYDNIVTKDYPASSSPLLNIHGSRTEYASFVYEKVLEIDIPNARKELGVGDISDKEVKKLCEIWHTIVRHPCMKLNLYHEQRNKIISITERCGHFPLLTAIACLKSTMDERKTEITRLGLNVVYGQAVQDLTDIALSLTLSRERVRQLRENCLDLLLIYPIIIFRDGLVNDYVYAAQTEYDFKHIREEEGVDFSNEYITICIAIANPTLHVIGDTRKSLLKTPGSVGRLYLVPTRIHKIFDFEKFILSIDDMHREKRFYPYRDDLDTFVRGQVEKYITVEDFHDIIKECRQILLKGYPDNIINSQIFFPANARKTIPYLIEDILREFNRPMTADEICTQLNERYQDLKQIPSKIGANALRNTNIVAVRRNSTYSLVEWNYTEKGGTIRQLAQEYLNSLMEPIAPLTDICDYIARFRSKVKISSVKANLLAESKNKFSIYFKDGVLYIGFTHSSFDDSFKMQEKRQCCRSFQENISRLEQFIKDNERFPFSSSLDAEEARLHRFFTISKANHKKGLLSTKEVTEIKRIEEEYGNLKSLIVSVSWSDRLERFVTYITENDTLPCPNSNEYAWYTESKALFAAGLLDPDKVLPFAMVNKIVEQMNK